MGFTTENTEGTEDGVGGRVHRGDAEGAMETCRGGHEGDLTGYPQITQMGWGRNHEGHEGDAAGFHRKGAKETCRGGPVWPPGARLTC